MFLRRKKELRVDLGDLESEKENLSSFLTAKLKVDVTSSGNKIMVGSNDLDVEDLKKLVTKFIYHQNLMNKYWAQVKSDSVQIKAFRRDEKREKKEHKRTQPSTIKHGW